MSFGIDPCTLQTFIQLALEKQRQQEAAAQKATTYTPVKKLVKCADGVYREEEKS
jgi:hypothetical protein